MSCTRIQSQSNKRQTNRRSVRLSVPPAAHWMRERASYRRCGHRHARSPVHSIDVAVGSNGHMMGSAREGRGVQPAAGSSGDGGTRSGNGGRRRGRGDEGRSCQSLSKHARHFCCDVCVAVVLATAAAAAGGCTKGTLGWSVERTQQQQQGGDGNTGERGGCCVNRRETVSHARLCSSRCFVVPSFLPGRVLSTSPAAPRRAVPAQVDTPRRDALQVPRSSRHTR